MESAEGARDFQLPGDVYDAFMGRYSRPLATLFADAAAVESGHRVLDVGCGPGALTGELVARCRRCAGVGDGPVGSLRGGVLVALP